MLARIFVGAITWLVVATSFAFAADRELIAGVWKGTYHCGNATAELSLIVDDRGDRFIFSYPNGASGEYSLKVNFNQKRRQISAQPLDWIDRPSGFNMVGFDGIVSEKVNSIQGNVRTCGKLELKRIVDEKAANAIISKHIGSSSAASARGGQKAPPASFYNSVWEGAWKGRAAKCADAPLDVYFVVAPSKSPLGTARVLIKQDKTSEWFEYEAQTESMNTETLLRVKIERPKGGPFSRGSFDFDIFVDRSDNSKKLGSSYRLQCRPFDLTKVPETEVPSASMADSAPVASFVGSWDGAIYSRRSRDREIALTIKESNPKSSDRAYDVEALIGEETQRLVLKPSGGNLQLEALREGNVPSSGPIRRGLLFTDIRYGGTKDLLVVRIDGQDEFAYLWRRKEAERPLQTTCKSVMSAWLSAQRDAMTIARGLKVALYPSLAGYDVNRAVMAEAIYGIPVGATQDLAEFRSTLYACAMTMPSVAVSDDKSPLAIFSDGADIARARAVLRTGFHPEVARLKEPATALDTSRFEAERQRAEADVAQLSFDRSDLATTNSMLAAAARSASVIQNARPSVAASALTALTDGLDALERGDAEARLNLLRQFAQQRMSGIEPPVGALSPAARSFLDTVTSGRANAFTPAESGFLYGMISRSIEACHEPSSATRLLLIDVIKRGMQLLIGTDFSGDLSSTLGSQLASHASIIEGANSSEAIGCGSPYLAAVYDILAYSPTHAALPNGERAPLFIRSCALDREASQCSCMKTVIQTLRPEVERMAFDRSMISTVINMNPTVGLELGTRCGVSNY
ncbi:hypothetical protein GCM10011390_44320 [Aureimonas endophytica]|uniref:Uncharacterized protein n=1 Tax=Aureimonas endophytica TaxID=2027858 RepID=A0A916ZZM8_9HYPH|nr:hypothetical protein [Aureimonas endophytica]GGE20211.1 hypothetical protein GCM10011390_44320 [Aureimonas endophytica]